MTAVARSLLRATAIPADGAGALRVTVPVIEAPPNTVPEERLKEVSTGVAARRVESARGFALAVKARQSNVRPNSGRRWFFKLK